MHVPLFVFTFVGMTILLGALKGNRIYRYVAVVWALVLGFGVAAIGAYMPAPEFFLTFGGAVALAGLLWVAGR
jgi:hypothetical protein